jgi:DNA primase
MVEEVVLALDADSAGQEAMLRAQRVAAGRKMRLRVATMPAGVDPAEMVAGPGGAERFQTLVEAAVELADFQVGLVLDRTDVSSPVERDRALTEVAPILAGLGESASREELIRRVAERLRMEAAMVMGRVVAARPTSGGSEQSASPRRVSATRGDEGQPPPRRPVELTSRERRERALLAMCIALPEEGRTYLDRLAIEHLSATGLQAATWLREHPGEPASELPSNPELASLITELVMLARNEPASRESMELNFLLLEQRRLEDELAAAGERGDYERRAALSRERAALVERIARTQRVET